MLSTFLYGFISAVNEYIYKTCCIYMYACMKFKLADMILMTEKLLKKCLLMFSYWQLENVHFIFCEIIRVGTHGNNTFANVLFCCNFFSFAHCTDHQMMQKHEIKIFAEFAYTNIIQLEFSLKAKTDKKKFKHSRSWMLE